MSKITADDEIQFPSGFGMRDVVSWGTTGMVIHDESSDTIIKVPFDHTDQECLLRLQRERQVYERFTQRGGHDGLLTYHGVFESGIRLQYAANHNLRLRVRDDKVTSVQRLRWAIQVADAVRFIHDAGVIHGDLTCANIFVDAALNAKVADFAGSSIDGSPLLVIVTESHEFPGPLLSIQADLLALGSVLYEIMTGHPPYQELDDTEISALYQKHIFPDTASLGAIGTIIQQCWQANYSGAGVIADDLRGISSISPRIKGRSTKVVVMKTEQESAAAPATPATPLKHGAFPETSTILLVVAVAVAIFFSAQKVSARLR